MAKKQQQQFVKLDYDLIHSSIHRKLSGSAVKIYEEIRASRNKKDPQGKMINTDDDHIEFGYSDVGGTVAKNTFIRALEELRARGFIKLMAPGGFPNKKAIYALSYKWRTYERSMREDSEQKSPPGGI